MTESLCQNFQEDDHFLLDDDNIIKAQCVRCSQHLDCPLHATSNIVNPTYPVNNPNLLSENMEHISIRGSNGLDDGITVSMDDHIESLEDSPLLINDCCRDSSDEFHCHDITIIRDDRKAWMKLLMASSLCFLFMMAELIGGYIAGSLAVMTDAAHLFSDLIGFLISLLSIWVGKKPPSRNMTFGYHRSEVLGALLSVQTVWLLAAIFSVLAINRLLKQEYDIDADIMMLVASLGLVVNLVMGAILHGACHKHSHGIQSHSTEENINVRAAAAHVLGDLLQSIGVLIAAIIIKFVPSAKIADPICTIIFSIVAICTTARVARDSILLLLEGNSKNFGEIYMDLESIPSVRHVHSLHVWSLAPGRDAASVHLAVDAYSNRDTVIKKASSIIRNHLNVISCTVQVELYNSSLVNSCKQCQIVNC